MRPQHVPTVPPAKNRHVSKIAILCAVGAMLVLSGCLSGSQDKELRLVNSTRHRHRVASVRDDQAAMGKAQAWSEHMARTGVLEHSGGGSRMDTSRLGRWCGVAENVGQGRTTESVHAAFLRSAPHRANILGRYDRSGFGVVRRGNTVWVTQVFLRSC